MKNLVLLSLLTLVSGSSVFASEDRSALALSEAQARLKKLLPALNKIHAETGRVLAGDCSVEKKNLEDYVVECDSGTAQVGESDEAEGYRITYAVRVFAPQGKMEAFVTLDKLNHWEN